MTLYMLDTNILADLVHDPAGTVAARIAEAGPEQVAVSIVVAGEVRFGAAKRGSARLERRVEQLLESIAVLPLEAPVDRTSATIRAALERAGTPIGPNDLFIAAHAKALGLTLVTDNVREFARVRGLKVVNWLRPD